MQIKLNRDYKSKWLFPSSEFIRHYLSHKHIKIVSKWGLLSCGFIGFSFVSVSSCPVIFGQRLHSLWDAKEMLDLSWSVTMKTSKPLRVSARLLWILSMVVVILVQHIFSYKHSKDLECQTVVWIQDCTFLRLSPWEMLSAVRKADTRWVMEPASPQWGRNWKVFSPLSLGTDS